MKRYSHKKIIVISSIILVIIMSFLAANKFSFSGLTIPNGTIDLLQSGWNYMPGATKNHDGVHISYLGRAIVKQDGSAGQDNPAVNLYGTHLRATNDYTLTATMRNITGEASFRLYASPPVIQDEFRVEPKSIDFRIKDSALTVSRWNGYKNENLRKQKPIQSTTYAITPQTSNHLTLQRTNNILAILFNGKEIQTFNYTDIFKNEVWFGASAINPNDSWTLASLNVASSNFFAIKAVNTQTLPIQKSSKDAAFQSIATSKRPNFLIGAAVALSPSIGDLDYRNLAYGGNFGMITTENALKWQFIHPHPGIYDFKEADALVDLAKDNNLRIQGHTLVFGEANPQWVQDLPTTTQSDKDNVKKIMIDHITKTVSHFKGRVDSWDVVNEPLASSVTKTTTLRPHKWYDAMGEDYIAIAFNAARQADPNAKLYVNDFGMEADGSRWKAMLALVTKLKKQGVTIDGVGFEGHVYEIGDEIGPSILRSHIRALAAIGVSSHISEMDVHDDNGTATQARQYADVLNACIHEPSCTSWTTWGVTDKYNLSESAAETLHYGHDFLWNERFIPTPAVDEMRKQLKK